MQRQPATDWDSTGCHLPGLQGRTIPYDFSVKYSNLPSNSSTNLVLVLKKSCLKNCDVSEILPNAKVSSHNFA